MMKLVLSWLAWAHCTTSSSVQLNYSTSWQHLKDIFRGAGSVQHVDIMEGPDGRSKGSAIVWFDTPESARKAIGEMYLFTKCHGYLFVVFYTSVTHLVFLVRFVLRLVRHLYLLPISLCRYVQ